MRKCARCGATDVELFQVGSGLIEPETGYVDLEDLCGKCVDLAVLESEFQQRG